MGKIRTILFGGKADTISQTTQASLKLVKVNELVLIDVEVEVLVLVLVDVLVLVEVDLDEPSLLLGDHDDPRMAPRCILKI